MSDERADLPGLGVPIGVNDRDGNPIHIGDWLRFDGLEWGRRGGKCEADGPEFLVCLQNGRLHILGAPSDLPNWCRIVRAWNTGIPPVSKPYNVPQDRWDRCDEHDRRQLVYGNDMIALVRTNRELRAEIAEVREAFRSQANGGAMETILRLYVQSKLRDALRDALRDDAQVHRAMATLKVAHERGDDAIDQIRKTIAVFCLNALGFDIANGESK